jgi:hypothetical protein
MPWGRRGFRLAPGAAKAEGFAMLVEDLGMAAKLAGL